MTEHERDRGTVGYKVSIKQVANVGEGAIV